MTHRIALSLSLAALALGAAGCGRETTPTGMKFGGVGLDPEEIGPEPEGYGGIVEYDYVDFAGAGLPLGLMGLVSYDEVSPGFSAVEPPYVLISGLAFIMEEDLPETQTLFGSFGAAGPAEGSCYTSYEPRAYLNNTADVGDVLVLRAADLDPADEDYFEFRIGRRPALWPKNNQEALFTYYMDIAAWQAGPLYHMSLEDGASSFDDASVEVLKPANWRHGGEVEVWFPGGLPPEEAPVGAIPLPITADDGNHRFRLPAKPEGVMLSWNGPQYSRAGTVIGEGEVRTCLQYLRHDTPPETPEDCLELQAPPDDPESDIDELADEALQMAQMYTGPWETDGGVTFEWIPSEEDVGDVVTISVRFLAPVDTDDKYKRVALKPVGDYGMREALACEKEGEDFEWLVDPALLDEDGNFIPSLQGEPTHTVAEVTCTVPDTGSFTITSELLENAMAYAARNDAGGVVFYFTRSTYSDIDTPPVRDRYGQRRDISAVRAVANSVLLGRFWYDGSWGFGL